MTHNSKCTLHISWCEGGDKRELNIDVFTPESATISIEACDCKRENAAPPLSETTVISYLHQFQELQTASMKVIVEHLIYYYSRFTEHCGYLGLTFAGLTLQICEDFRHYLLTCPSEQNEERRLKRNTASCLFSVFKSMLKDAYKKEYLPRMIMVDGIGLEETHREHLTSEELKALFLTPCRWQYIRRSALFSALTGLRYSDLKALTWGQFSTSADGSVWLNLRIIKTRTEVTLPVTAEAVAICGARGEDSELVFSGMRHGNLDNARLGAWVRQAGISKHITYHCMRHTFAMRLLNDAHEQPTTVQALLGHSDINTTMVYAKVLRQTTRSAVDNPCLRISPEIQNT